MFFEDIYKDHSDYSWQLEKNMYSVSQKQRLRIEGVLLVTWPKHLFDVRFPTPHFGQMFIK